ncbi:MAG: TatD family hydrolase, partial [Bacilli bacterium]
MAIDSHMHINRMVLKNTKKYIDEINSNHNIDSVINVGLDIDTSNESLMISNINSKFYSTVGIHPLYTELQDI